MAAMRVGRKRVMEMDWLSIEETIVSPASV
jgi:hypothetical protein